MVSSFVPMFLYWGPQLAVFYNDAAIPIVERRHPAALGQPFPEVWPEAWPLLREDLQATMQGSGIRREKIHIPLERSGTLRDFYFDYAYNPVLEGSQVGGVLVICQDVTAQLEASRHAQTVTDSLHQVLERTSDGVAIIDREWRFSYLNLRATNLLAGVGELMGRNVWQTFPAMIYPGSPYELHYRQAMHHAIAAEFETVYPEPLNWTLHISVHPAPEGIVVFFRDLTGDRQREEALVLTEKLAAVGRMASSIAHEINNPLESVTNLLYLARHTQNVPDADQYLDLAELELRRVAHIVNQTLRFHRQTTRAELVSCMDLFGNVLLMYESRLRNAGIAVERRKRATKQVEVYEGEIRQVLNNLIGNAIDAMPLGGRLLLRSREATDWRTGRTGLVLTVADTGVGMDPSTRHRIFQAFFTTKGAGGTGLGLWVSGEIVERHRGRLSVRSSTRIGRSGTVMALFLPFGSPASRPPAAAS
jgi:signal transduction histidine kinase